MEGYQMSLHGWDYSTLLYAAITEPTEKQKAFVDLEATGNPNFRYGRFIEAKGITTGMALKMSVIVRVGMIQLVLVITEGIF
jgi:hypothetical protein